MEDPIFEPWSAGDERPRAPMRWRPSPGAAPSLPPRPAPKAETPRHAAPAPAPTGPTGATALLRAEGLPALRAVAHRLEAARHGTGLHDLLDQEPSLLRLTLAPWAGPLAGSGAGASAVLEIGPLPDGDDRIRVWCWVDPTAEAPEVVSTVPPSGVTARWVEGVALDFVRRVLGRH